MTTQPKRFIARRDEAAALARGEVVEIRRAMKPQPRIDQYGWCRWGGSGNATYLAWHESEPPHLDVPEWPIGSRWWVAETHAVRAGHLIGSHTTPIWFRAQTGESKTMQWNFTPLTDRGPWRSPVAMPRWASRTDAVVLAVRIERGERWEWVITFKGEST